MKGRRERDLLTNETIRGFFRNNFELAQYGIRLGRYLIKSGHEVELDTLLDEIRKHPNPNYLNELKEIDAIEETEEPSENA